MVRFLAVLLLTILMGGCATAPEGPKKRFFWPDYPDIPRVEWKGYYQNKAHLASTSVLSSILGEEDNINLGFPVFAAGDGMGKIFVADHKLFGVVVFDFKEKTTRMLGAESTNITRPTGIGFDSDGNIYVGDTANQTVYVFDRQEKFLRALNFAKDAKSIAFLAIDKPGKRLIFPDVQGHKIVIADLNGKVLKSFGERGQGDGRFNFPSAVALDPQGNIVVCDQMNARIQIFAPDGTFKSKFGRRGDGIGEFNIIKGVAVDSEGHIYVTDGRSHRFSIFNDMGEVMLSVGAGKSEANPEVTSVGGFNLPNGIFIDQNDAIYVGDVLNLRVQVFQYLNEKYLRENPLPPPPPGKEPKP